MPIDAGILARILGRDLHFTGGEVPKCLPYTPLHANGLKLVPYSLASKLTKKRAEPA